MLARSLRRRPPDHARPSRGDARGFTLFEVLAVVMIIAILAVAAAPVFVNLMRDRRVNSAALNVADMYRVARTRALGRGRPVLVRWDYDGGKKVNGGTGLLTLLEPMTNVEFAVETCGSVKWNDVNEVREIGRFDFGSGLYDLADVQFYQAPLADSLFTDPAANPGATAKADVCFMPSGSTSMRSDPGDPFTTLSTVPAYRVKNKDSGLLRFVFVPPNGVARLKL